MTEWRAIDSIKKMKMETAERYVDRHKAFDLAIKTLQEIQQYQTIGTVDECREAIEKQKKKKSVLNVNSNVRFCPVCERKVRRNYDLHCSGCGQAIDWSDTT